MSESKLELNERKIRNGIRKEKEAREKKLWDTLSTEYRPPPFAVTFRMGPLNLTTQPVTAKTHNAKKSWDEVDLKGKTFDTVIIDEIAKKDE